MNKILLILFFGYSSIQSVFSQTITGIVIAARGQTPLAGASIAFIHSPQKSATNQAGAFSVTISTKPDTMIISYVGYKTRHLLVIEPLNSFYTIVLEENDNQLQEVTVNTGYYQAAKERATGSFAQVGNALLNRNVSNNILDRLEDVTSGLQFDRRNITGENVMGQRPALRVRGLSTILGGASPLIVVDNFPYNGDISSINPNDVESVTVLKDAAAASIWGARAGNGVIVINTKQGKYYQQTRINFNSSINITDKPDLFYTRNYLPSNTVMNIQEELFTKKVYLEDNMNYIPAYVELLIKQRDNIISASAFEARQLQMQQTDFRNQALQYLYRSGIQQQYALNMNGGGSIFKYYLSAGYDNNLDNVVDNSNKRINLNFQNSFKINPKLELNMGMWYTRQNAANKGITYSSISNGIREPYTLLADGQGNALSTGYILTRTSYRERAVNNGLLDWQYRPLDELKLTEQTSGSDEIRVNAGLKYKFLNYFDVNITYQYIRGANQNQSYYDADSYYARNLVNSLTQANGQRIVPYGGILDGSPEDKYQSHSGRFQLNYNRSFAGDHQVVALVGTDITQQTAQTFPGYRLYNYSEETLGGAQNFDYTTYYPSNPSGSMRIIGASGIAGKTNNRNLSHFSNGAYTFKEKYTLSASGRWDGSNLLGVKTNQRGTILWSTGGSWDISKERFYKVNWLPYLRVRATYGSGGLIDKSQSQYPTIAFYTDPNTNLPYANLQSPGNPSLRWEQVNTLNLGLDWSSKGQRVSGSLEWYNKKANYLLGNILLDPTTGAGSNFKQNYADMRTNGFDVVVNSVNLKALLRWETNLLVGYTSNKVTNYSSPTVNNIYGHFSTSIKPPVIGRSADAIYALPWNGLDHTTGLPVIYINDQQSTDYTTYINSYKPENLIVAGVDVPPVFGSLRNTISWKGVQLSALVSFKVGYVFRRMSMEPGAEYLTSNAKMNTDYFLRWKQPGDETKTNVPAAIQAYNSYLGTAYQYSDILITSGNHIRLQDVNLSYSLPSKISSRLHFQNIKLYMKGNNLGILWRKNKFGIDPDYPNAEFPASKSFAFGLQIGL